MPMVTCPYCQQLSLSKFIHKEHLRSAHPHEFERNIRTTITGSAVEVARQPVKVVLPTTDCFDYNGGLVSVRFSHGFYDFSVEFSIDLLWDQLADKVLDGFLSTPNTVLARTRQLSTASSSPSEVDDDATPILLELPGPGDDCLLSVDAPGDELFYDCVESLPQEMEVGE